MRREKLQLTFECDQDWDDMRPTACGRFCDVCKKEVHDLTGKSTREIKQLKAADSEMCGMFTIDQVETGLAPVDFKFVRKVRYYAAALATFLGLETGYANERSAQRYAIEIVAKDNITTHAPKPGDHPTGRDSRKKKRLSFKKHPKPDEPVKKKKKKVYLSKRFPFIHLRRPRIAGKF